MSAFWCESAWIDDRVQQRVRVLADSAGMISTVTVDTDPVAEDVRLSGLVFGGFANAHSHAFHRALRGRTHGDGQRRGSFWTWRDQMYAVAARLDPDSYFELARAVYAEMIMTGICAVAEFHYLHHDVDGRPYANPNAMGDALQAAAAEAGIRLTLLDTCYLRGGLSAQSYHDPDPIQRRFSDGTVDAWGRRHDQLRAQKGAVIGTAVHSIRAVEPVDLPAVVEAAGEEPLHLHLSEQPAENKACLAVHGRTPTRVFADAGVLGPRTVAVHATHLTAEDIELLAGSGVCLCPTTERDLADGIGPGRGLADAGVTLSVGSDSHAVIDLLEEVRGVETHERLASQMRGHFSPADQVRILTEQGYAAVGRSGGGAIAEGSTGDLVAVATDSIRTAGVTPEQLIMAATSADVTDVVVGGVRQVNSREHRLGAVGELLARALEPLQEES